ncbi:hypothetical protein K0M31_011287 [Melipona bicolor]|uniref:Uncharacterized protein n=1 Tax=Melipona bicolor TaxID=60889 RepID=A0AA40G992_9HYME|nr:hypothetical protein K0M31_011287 [Melipona bicolor]
MYISTCMSTTHIHTKFENSRTHHEAPLLLAKNYFYLVSFLVIDGRIWLAGRDRCLAAGRQNTLPVKKKLFKRTSRFVQSLSYGRLARGVRIDERKRSPEPTRRRSLDVKIPSSVACSSKSERRFCFESRGKIRSRRPSTQISRRE